MNLIDMLKAFVNLPRGGHHPAHQVPACARRATGRMCLVGLAIAVANIDEVIALIRNAPDPATAREQLMERRWPAMDMEPLIRLDRRSAPPVSEDGTYNLSEEQARAILDLRLQRLTALGRDEIGDELNKIGEEIKRLSRNSRLARFDAADRQGRVDRRARRVRHAAPHRDRRRRSGHGRRGPDRARRHGRDRVSMPATSSGCRFRPTGRSAAAARAARAWRPRTRISSPGSLSPTRIRRCCSSPRAASSTSEKVWRLPIGTPQARGKAWSTCCRLKGRADHLDHAAAGG
jgi:DNA gyrase subunit A